MPFCSFLSLESIQSILWLECPFSPFWVLVAPSFRTQLRCSLLIRGLPQLPSSYQLHFLWYLYTGSIAHVIYAIVLHIHFSLEGQIISVSPDSPKHRVKRNKQTYSPLAAHIYFYVYLNRESTHVKECLNLSLPLV